MLTHSSVHKKKPETLKEVNEFIRGFYQYQFLRQDSGVVVFEKMDDEHGRESLRYEAVTAREISKVLDQQPDQWEAWKLRMNALNCASRFASGLAEHEMRDGLNPFLFSADFLADIAAGELPRTPGRGDYLFSSIQAAKEQLPLMGMTIKMDRYYQAMELNEGRSPQNDIAACGHFVSLFKDYYYVSLSDYDVKYGKYWSEEAGNLPKLTAEEINDILARDEKAALPVRRMAANVAYDVFKKKIVSQKYYYGDQFCDITAVELVRGGEAYMDEFYHEHVDLLMMVAAGESMCDKHTPFLRDCYALSNRATPLVHGR